MTNKDWVTVLEFRRGQLVRAFGGSAVDLNGITAAILPLILVVSILDRYILADIISNPFIRGVAALASGIVIEIYAIAVMILDHEVSTFNRSLRPGEVSIEYNGKAAKRNYITLLVLVVVFGHILPGILEALLSWLWPSAVGLATQPVRLVVLFMAFISWYSYEIFSTNYLLREKLLKRIELDARIDQEKEKADLAHSAEMFAERSKTQNEIALTLARAKEIEAEAKRSNANAREIRAHGSVSQEAQGVSPAAPVISPVAQAREMDSQGFTRAEIASILKISRKRVNRILGESNGHEEKIPSANGMGT